MNFSETIRQYIRAHKLLSEKGKYLVALSGGADSVALLIVLHSLGYEIEACHCNFQLRGREADRDENFCVQLCARLGIPLHRIHFDTRLYADVHKVSIEMAARDLRYRYFGQLMKDVEAEAICVAHHQDDSVETILINLIRGTGIRGLTGISPKNGNIVRPLLCVGRADILQYLSEKGQDYVTDSTNLIDDVVRNKIRLNILPLLKGINPAVCDNIMRTADNLQQAGKMLEYFNSQLIPVDGDVKSANQDSEDVCPVRRNAYGHIYISKHWVENSPSMEYVLHEALQPYCFAASVTEEIIASWTSVGRCWESSKHLLVNDRQHLIVCEKKEPFCSKMIPETGTYILPSQTVLLPLDAACEEGNLAGKEQKLKLSIMEKTADFVPSKNSYLVTLDADKLNFPLRLRLCQKGDIFHPFGMKGRKLVSDYLTDRKKSLLDKQQQLVLEDKSGEIIWLVGERTSECCRICDFTRKILKVEISF